MGASVPFDIPLHQAFVQGHGQTLTYYKASQCPCAIAPYAPDSNRTLLSCKVCLGFGYLYNAPITITGLITGIRNAKDLVDAGIAGAGDLVLGMAPGALFIGDYDIVNISNLPVSFTGAINIRGAGSTDTVPFRLSQMFRVFSVIPSTGVVHDYVQGTDYTVSGRTITWINTTNVTTNLPAGTSYSINANVFFDWVCFASPMERIDTPSTNLGQRVLLRKRDITIPISIA